MKVWPVPNSYKKMIPRKGEVGSFWEDRGDRYHCGIDIYAPVESEVVAIENGYVIDIGDFTKENQSHYWTNTKYLIIKTDKKLLVKYAELIEVYVHIGDYIDSAQTIGKIGNVIKEDSVSYEDPFYLQELAETGNVSMLHLEIYKAPVTIVQPYTAGNYLGERRPESLIDPTFYLNGLAKKLQRENKINP